MHSRRSTGRRSSRAGTRGCCAARTEDRVRGRSAVATEIVEVRARQDPRHRGPDVRVRCGARPFRERDFACCGITVGSSLSIRGVARIRAEGDSNPTREARFQGWRGARPATDPGRNARPLLVKSFTRRAPVEPVLAERTRGEPESGPCGAAGRRIVGVICVEGVQHDREVCGRDAGSDLTRSSPREPRSERRASRWPPFGTGERKRLDHSDL